MGIFFFFYDFWFNFQLNLYTFSLIIATEFEQADIM